jgi:hypothetical protein
MIVVEVFGSYGDQEHVVYLSALWFPRHEEVASGWLTGVVSRFAGLSALSLPQLQEDILPAGTS